MTCLTGWKSRGKASQRHLKRSAVVMFSSVIVWVACNSKSFFSSGDCALRWVGPCLAPLHLPLPLPGNLCFWRCSAQTTVPIYVIKTCTTLYGARCALCMAGRLIGQTYLACWSGHVLGAMKCLCCILMVLLGCNWLIPCVLTALIGKESLKGFNSKAKTEGGEAARCLSKLYSQWEVCYWTNLTKKLHTQSSKI